MIDIKEMRRLVQAATPGPWWVNRDGLTHGFARGVVEINTNDWHALAGTWAVNGAKPSDEGVANAEFIAAANPATILELLDRLEVAEEERDALRAKIEQMEEQEPVAWGVFHFGGKRNGKLYSHCESEKQARMYILDRHQSDDSNTFREAPLYALPGAKGEEK